MNNLENVLICTDLDGTILRNDKTISAKNKEAIEYFKSKGGIFTFVTGRMPQYAEDACALIEPNAPFGCINGAGLFDPVKNEYIWTAPIHESVVDLIKYADEIFPNIGIQVCTYYKTYFCKENDAMENFRKVTHLPNLVSHYDKIEEPMAKIIFGSEDADEILKLEKALTSHPLAVNFDFTRSERTLYEILPKGAGKGVSIEKLTQILNIDKNKTIAIGDYNNDISMFKSAKAGIAVSNACKEALDASDFVTVSNEEDAIAQVIYDLENGNYL